MKRKISITTTYELVFTLLFEIEGRVEREWSFQAMSQLTQPSYSSDPLQMTSMNLPARQVSLDM